MAFCQYLVLYLVGFILNMNTITSRAVNEDVNRSYLAPFLGKRYELIYSDDKFNDILKALGVGLIKRNLAKLAKPVIELTENDGKYTLTSDYIFKNYTVSFEIGKEFEHLSLDDRVVKCIFTQDKNKLTQTEKGKKTIVVVREFLDDEVRVTIRVDDIVCVLKYTLISQW